MTLQNILGNLATAMLPSLVAFGFFYFMRVDPKKLAHSAAIGLLASLILPALSVDGKVLYGWQVLGLSCLLILTPPGLMSAVANASFTLSYFLLLRKSDKMFYWARFNPGIALAATTLSLFAGTRPFFQFDFRYQPDNRILFGAGIWICSQFLLAMAYSKNNAQEHAQPRQLRFRSYALLTLVAVVLIINIVLVWPSVQEVRAQRVNFVSFTPDGRQLVSSITFERGGLYDLEVDERVVIWSLATNQQLQCFDLETDFPTCYELSPLGDLFAYGVVEEPYGPDTKGTIVLMSTETGGTLAKLKGHTGEVLDISFSYDGSTIATACRDRTARLWRVSDGIELMRFDADKQVLSVGLSPNSKTLAYSTMGTVVLFSELDSEPKQTTLSGAPSSTYSKVVFSNNDQALNGVSWDGVVTTWKLGTLAQPVSIPNQVPRVTSMRFSPTREMFAYGSYEKAAILWDCVEEKTIKILKHPVDVRSVAFSPDGRFLATGEGGTWSFEAAEAIRIWNVTTGQLESTLDLSTAQLAN